MTNQNPISVPDELLRQWCQWNPEQTPEGLWRKIADNSAQWGADQELEACCLLLDSGEHAATYGCHDGTSLRTARRPKPPIEADQVLAVLSTAPKAGVPTVTLDVDQFDTILLALKRMKEMEGPAND